MVDADTKEYSVVVPAGTVAARFSLDAGDDTSDLDLWVYKDGEFVDLSASGAADEQVTMLAPAEGTYDVYVNGFTTPGGSTSYETVQLRGSRRSRWATATVTPDPGRRSQSATPTTLTGSWTGLDTAKRWFGVITYAGADAVTYFSVG